MAYIRRVPSPDSINPLYWQPTNGTSGAYKLSDRDKHFVRGRYNEYITYKARSVWCKNCLHNDNKISMHIIHILLQNWVCTVQHFLITLDQVILVQFLTQWERIKMAAILPDILSQFYRMTTMTFFIEISIKFIFKSKNNYKPALVPSLVWRQTYGKPLSGPVTYDPW